MTKIVAKKKLKKKEVHVKGHVGLSHKTKTAIAVGSATAAVVIAGAVVLNAPVSVTIIERGDENFEDRMMGMQTTMLKSMTTPLADQMERPLSISPAKVEGYEYTGCTDENGERFDTKRRHLIYKDITLYYNYRPLMTPVAFVEDDKISLVKNETIANAVDPTQVAPAYADAHPYEDFTGWTVLDDGTKTDIIKTSEGAAKIYEAQWTGKTYHITYNLDGGTSGSNPDTYQYGVGVESLWDASKPGYNFDGWYDDSGNKVESIAKDAHDDIHLTAHWTAAPVARPAVHYGGGASRGSASTTNDNAQSESSGGVFRYWGNAGAVAFDTGYSAGLNWGLDQCNIDPPHIGGIENQVASSGDSEYEWVELEDGSRAYRPKNFKQWHSYGIADHDNDGAGQIDSATELYLCVDGQTYTLHKLQTVYDDSEGHYGNPCKESDLAAELQAIVVFQTCTSTGVEYVLWG